MDTALYKTAILINLLSIAVVSSCSAGCSTKFDNKRIHSLNIEAKMYYNQGLQYAQENRAEDAVRAFSKSIEIDPSAAAYNGRSVEYYRTGLYDLAITDANKAIMMSPKYAMPYVSRGNAYFKMNNYDSALKSYSRAINLDPAKAEYHYNLAQAYYKKGLLDEAFASYGKTVELDPHHYAAYYNRACIYSQKKDHAGTISSLERAIAEGYADADRMKREPALENVRNMPKFRILLLKIGRRGKGAQ